MAGPLPGGRGETHVSRSQASVPRARRPASPPWARAGPQVGMWPRQGEARDVVFGSLTFVTLRRGGAQDSGLHAGRAQAVRGRCGCAGMWAARRWGALCAGARRAQHRAPCPRSLARRGRCCPRGGPGRPRPRCVWFAAARGGGRTSAVQRRDAEAEPQVCPRPAGRKAGVARGALAAERPGNRGFPCSPGSRLLCGVELARSSASATRVGAAGPAACAILALLFLSQSVGYRPSVAFENSLLDSR